MTSSPLTGVALLAAAFLTAPALAAADLKKACADAYVQAQQLRKESKLLAARERLTTCAQDACPKTLRAECIQWLSEVADATPTLVLEARDSEGRELVDVRISVDGEPLLSQIEGRAVPVDPGVRVFRFEMDGAEPIDKRVVVHVGDKNRRIAVAFPRQGREREIPRPPVREEPDAAPASRPVPPLAYVFGGVALAGAAAFTYFAIRTDDKVGELDARGCKPSCPESEVDDAKRSQTFGYVSLGVSAVSAAFALLFYATRPEQPAHAARLELRPSREGLGAAVGLSF
jgi:hypothetical protein